MLKGRVVASHDPIVVLIYRTPPPVIENNYFQSFTDPIPVSTEAEPMIMRLTISATNFGAQSPTYDEET